MRLASRGLVGMGLLVTGYLFGVSGAFLSDSVLGQDAAAQLTDDTVDKLKNANDALTTAMIALQQENVYTPATKGVNSFLVSTGGGDAIADLENGRGVDPETFAALYADLAIDEVAQHLSKDEEGRLTYKGKLVRIYPIARLKGLFTKRSGEED